MFTKASRLKVRFNHKGQCSVEDLWDIPLVNLDTMYQALSSEFKDQGGMTSLLFKNTNVDEVLTLKLNIIKHVVETRLVEQQEVKKAISKKAKKQKIMSLIDQKQDESLMGQSVDELKALLETI